MITARAKLSMPITSRGWRRSSSRPRIAPVTTPGRSKQRMTRPTAAPEPVNCSTNQSKAMMVNWSPRYEILSPSQSRWNAGSRNGAPTAAVRAIRCPTLSLLLVRKHLTPGFHCEGNDNEPDSKGNRCKGNWLAESPHSANQRAHPEVNPCGNEASERSGKRKRCRAHRGVVLLRQPKTEDGEVAAKEA